MVLAPFGSLHVRVGVVPGVWMARESHGIILGYARQMGSGTWADLWLDFYEPDGQPFEWMVGYQLDDEPNLYMGNGCFTKHPFKTSCLEFQVPIIPTFSQSSDRWGGFPWPWRQKLDGWCHHHECSNLFCGDGAGMLIFGCTMEIWWRLDSPAQHRKDDHDRYR